MLLDETFDADDVLRDMDEMYVEEDVDDGEGDMRELNFGNTFDDNDNFNDITSDMDTAEDMWE